MNESGMDEPCTDEPFTDELRTALELATESELQDLTEILFRKKFNPLDYLHTPDPIAIQSQDRTAWIDALEERFRFLAADGYTVLKGKTHQVSYRQVLIRVGDHLKLRLSPRLSTTDLEAEIFLSLLQRLWKRLPAKQKTILSNQVEQSLAQAALLQSLGPELRRDPLRLLMEGGTALAVNALLRPMLIQLVTRQFMTHWVASQVALPLQLQGQAALQMARQGMALNAARFGLARGAVACLGSALWIWFVADLGWRTIATNYGRVIPTIFALAQIRLIRSESYMPFPA
jgi:uncharacterized protein YaaW (UPF0174 family)